MRIPKNTVVRKGVEGGGSPARAASRADWNEGSWAHAERDREGRVGGTSMGVSQSRHHPQLCPALEPLHLLNREVSPEWMLG